LASVKNLRRGNSLSDFARYSRDDFFLHVTQADDFDILIALESPALRARAFRHNPGSLPRTFAHGFPKKYVAA